MRSVSWSVQGKARSQYQDAYLCRDDAGVWAVADGVGGLGNGAIASRYIIDTLAGLNITGDMETDLGGCLTELQAVNAHFHQSANPSPLASTLCGLIHSGGHCAVLWVGDSRAYRISNGHCIQLTQDHGGSVMGVADNVITRAFGSSEPIVVDRKLIEEREDEQILLCTDGFYRTLEKAGISIAEGAAGAESTSTEDWLLSVSNNLEFADDATWVLISCT